MNYLALRYFIEVSRHLNFSRAAESLHISQPTLSEHITSLEKQIGVKLFNRSTRKVYFTDVGFYLYKELSDDFSNIDSTLNLLIKNKKIPNPIIKIATVPSAANIIIPRLLKKLLKSFSDANFYLQETDSKQAIKLIMNNQFSLAFIRTPINKNFSKLNYIEFAKYPLKLIVSVHHPLSSKKSVHISELKNEMFIHFDDNDDADTSPLQFLLEKTCLSNGFFPKKICSGAELLTVSRLVSNNLGIALVPKDIVQLIDLTSIRVINIDQVNITSSISAVWPKNYNIPNVIVKILNNIKLSQQVS
jgi:DNA-binding transcriptional LysR family regulator